MASNDSSKKKKMSAPPPVKSLWSKIVEIIGTAADGDTIRGKRLFSYSNLLKFSKTFNPEGVIVGNDGDIINDEPYTDDQKEELKNFIIWSQVMVERIETLLKGGNDGEFEGIANRTRYVHQNTNISRMERLKQLMNNSSIKPGGKVIQESVDIAMQIQDLMTCLEFFSLIERDEISDIDAFMAALPDINGYEPRHIYIHDTISGKEVLRDTRTMLTNLHSVPKGKEFTALLRKKEHLELSISVLKTKMYEIGFETYNYDSQLKDKNFKKKGDTTKYKEKKELEQMKKRIRKEKRDLLFLLGDFSMLPSDVKIPKFWRVTREQGGAAADAGGAGGGESKSGNIVRFDFSDENHPRQPYQVVPTCRKCGISSDAMEFSEMKGFWHCKNCKSNNRRDTWMKQIAVAKTPWIVATEADRREVKHFLDNDVAKILAMEPSDLTPEEVISLHIKKYKRGNSKDGIRAAGRIMPGRLESYRQGFYRKAMSEPGPFKFVTIPEFYAFHQNRKNVLAMLQSRYRGKATKIKGFIGLYKRYQEEKLMAIKPKDPPSSHAELMRRFVASEPKYSPDRQEAPAAAPAVAAPAADGGGGGGGGGESKAALPPVPTAVVVPAIEEPEFIEGFKGPKLDPKTTSFSNKARYPPPPTKDDDAFQTTNPKKIKPGKSAPFLRVASKTGNYKDQSNRESVDVYPASPENWNKEQRKHFYEFYKNLRPATNPEHRRFGEKPEYFAPTAPQVTLGGPAVPTADGGGGGGGGAQNPGLSEEMKANGWRSRYSRSQPGRIVYSNPRKGIRARWEPPRLVESTNSENPEETVRDFIGGRKRTRKQRRKKRKTRRKKNKTKKTRKRRRKRRNTRRKSY